MQRIWLWGLVGLGMLMGCDRGMSSTASPVSSVTQAVSASSTPIPAGARIVDIKVTDRGYEPSEVSAKKGEVLALRFTRTTSSGCLTQIWIPSSNIKKDLPLNVAETVVVTADKAGEIVFQCGMAMMRGKIVVSE